jgi:hypothetical protein
MSGEGFGSWTQTSDGVNVDIISPDGAERLEIRRAPHDHPDMSVLLDGVLYGPDTYARCRAAAVRLHRDLDWWITNTGKALREEAVRREEPLSALEAMAAPPGQQYRDPSSNGDD